MILIKRARVVISSTGIILSEEKKIQNEKKINFKEFISYFPFEFTISALERWTITIFTKKVITEAIKFLYPLKKYPALL